MFAGRALLLVGVVCLAGPALAQSSTTFTGEQWMHARLSSLVRANRKISYIEQRMMRFFQNSDIDGNGVSLSDHKLARQMQAASQRGREIGRLLGRDLNGDGKITRSEVEAAVGSRARQHIYVQGVLIKPTPGQVAKVLDKLMKREMRSDRNNDGVISFAELAAAASKKFRRPTYLSYKEKQRVPLTLDGNGDGRVTLKEYKAALARVLMSVDRDGDGTISSLEASDFRSIGSAALRAERSAYRQRRQNDRLADLVKQCAFPKAGKSVQLMLVGAYQGRGISDISIGGDDVEVTASEVRIEPGAAPLYVVLTSYNAMVWKFTGATDRVAQVVVQSIRGTGKAGSRSGVVGLAKSRVYFSPKTQCLRYFSSASSTTGLRTSTRLALLVGRKPNRVFGSFGAARVSLPNGRIEQSVHIATGALPALDKAGAPIWRAMKHYAPGGLVSVQPSKVVAKQPVKRVSVLPHMAGIAQLLDRGVLEIVDRVPAFNLRGIGRGGGGAWGPPLGTGRGAAQSGPQHPREFRILKKMRFPAGLTRSHGVRFLLGRGVPMPSGDPGASCVMSEDTGQRVAGRGRC